MKWDKSYLPEVYQLKTSLLHKWHMYSMYIDQPFKLVILEAKHLYANNSFLLILTGVGKKLKMDGCLDGLLYQKQAACSELLHCSCKKSYQGLCKCYRVN